MSIEFADHVSFMTDRSSSPVCAITSRYYPEKAEIYPIAMHFALNECANALMHGWKCIELSQAFMLLTMYAHPAKRWEEERSYLYGGLAMRSVHSLHLQHMSPDVLMQDCDRP